RVSGPPNKIQPKYFFFDYVLADQSVLEKEEVKNLFDNDFPGIDLRGRYYVDALDTPGWPASDLFILGDDPKVTTDGLVPPIHDGVNILSLSGHGWWTGCCGLNESSVPDLKNGFQGGLAYADSCLTGRFVDTFFMTRTILSWPNGGVAAWAGNTSFSWIGT